MKMIEIQVLNKKTKEYNEWKYDKYSVALPTEIIEFGRYVGIDPGTTHLGLAELYSVDNKDKVTLWQITISRQEDAIKRMRLHHFIMGKCLYIPSHMIGNASDTNCVVEGASFGNTFRQVELAEQRIILAWWMFDSSPTHIVPPTTIRKAVFGSGKIKAHEAWQLAGIPKNKQPNDALAALSCAYYGMMKGE